MKPLLIFGYDVAKSQKWVKYPLALRKYNPDRQQSRRPTSAATLSSEWVSAHSRIGNKQHWSAINCARLKCISPPPPIHSKWSVALDRPTLTHQKILSRRGASATPNISNRVKSISSSLCSKSNNKKGGPEASRVCLAHPPLSNYGGFAMFSIYTPINNFFGMTMSFQKVKRCGRIK